MDYKKFCKMCFENREPDELFPDGTDAQKALEILVDHFLGEFVITYPGNTKQWNSEAVAEILRQYPEGKLRRIKRKS